jgi:tagatose 1,6-diphosphate aldolase
MNRGKNTIMAKIKISRGKYEALQACMNEKGIIAAVAMDQRDSLRKSIEKVGGRPVPDEVLATFKREVTKILTRYASAVLLDPEYGLPALEQCAPGKGVLLSYERTSYDANISGRLPALLPNWSVRRLREVGASAIKVLLYYDPFGDERVNDIKRAFIERVGSECAAQDIPFFLEPLAYKDTYDEKSFAFATLKPQYIYAIMEEFSKPYYGVDILKVEMPINSAYLAGSRAYQGGEFAYDHQTALEHLKAAASAAKKPFLYLSAGVDDAVFREQLELAAEAGVPFSGVLCGRATWKGGIQPFLTGGPERLDDWLLDQGIQNIQALNKTLNACAQPWHTIYEGLENIEIV